MDEFGRIDRFLSHFHRLRAPRGPGDDCAVLAPSRGQLCLTTDALVEGVHFTRPAFSPQDIGHKALASNLSDLAAMGAHPAWMLCALGLPDDFSVAELEALADGMAALANAHGVDLLGGNVTKSPVLSVTLTLGGVVLPGHHPLLRSGAKPGDVLYLSGGVGDAARGYQVLARKKKPAAWQAPLLEAQRRPLPHLALGEAIAPYASACIDISDGLVQDLGHLCRASHVAAELDSGRLPLSDALLKDAGSREAALHDALAGGEDYVLLFTVPAPKQAKLLRTLAAAGLGAVPVGRVVKGKGVKVDGKPWTGKGGFQHF